jgi:hypothetical protein
MARDGSGSSIAGIDIPRAIATSCAAGAERGGYGSVAMMLPKSGKSDAVTSPMSLSLMMPKTRRRGGATCSAMNGAMTRMACALCPPSIQIAFPARSIFSSRPRHSVVATPRSIDSGVILVSIGRSSSAARTASAALRC